VPEKLPQGSTFDPRIKSPVAIDHFRLRVFFPPNQVDMPESSESKEPTYVECSEEEGEQGNVHVFVSDDMLSWPHSETVGGED